MTTQPWLQILLWITMTTVVCALKCWKCVAPDCETDPAENYKAAPETCAQGQQCMKVRYRMFDNTTHYDSVIRTCTNGPCKPTSHEEFRRCLHTHKHYMISGCALRSCCRDRDLCNSAHRVTWSGMSQCAVIMACVYSWYQTRTT